MDNIQLFQGDCLRVMKVIPDKSVDMEEVSRGRKKGKLFTVCDSSRYRRRFSFA